ncbi:hypothetical protein DFP73DRAFT_608386 [Morchella snyderi]|nr:hypothetical protein DFP73DRAFT_608386 [Morchella snyderi]
MTKSNSGIAGVQHRKGGAMFRTACLEGGVCLVPLRLPCVLSHNYAPGSSNTPMPPKRPAPDTVDATDTTDAALMPPPPPHPRPTTPSSKRRRTSHTHHTPSTTAPPSLFFTIPLPPPYNPSPLSSTHDAENTEPPSDSQFAALLHSAITALPAATQALYHAAMANLRSENTPELTGEMRASLTSAVTAFVVHLPALEWVNDGDGGEGGESRFLTRLARGEVTGRELVVWADTVTAALRAFTGTGGSPAPSCPSSRASSSSPTPTPAQSPTPPPPATGPTPTRTPGATTTAPSNHHRSSASGRSGTLRTSTLTRDASACVLTAIIEPTTLDAAHIIPFSVRGAKADAFWGFLGLFLGAPGAERVRAVTLQLATGAAGAGANTAAAAGELANCVTLEARAHRYFDAGAIEMVPIAGSGNWNGEYDPSVVSSYDITLSFPGQALLPLSRYRYSGATPPQLLSSVQLTPGDTVTLSTPDPARWPLPHPLLLQLHVLCGRVKRLRAAAGWPVLPAGDGSEEGVGVGWGEEEDGWDEEEEGEEEVAEVALGKAVYGVVSPAGSVQGWVLGCRAEGGVGDEPGIGGGGLKRKYGAEMGGQEGGGEGDEVLERPRKVAVVMGEMGMREEERWGLVKGRARRV